MLGEHVTGHICLELTEPLPVHTISTRLRGSYIVAFEQKLEGESVFRDIINPVCIYNVDVIVI